MEAWECNVSDKKEEEAYALRRSTRQSQSAKRRASKRASLTPFESVDVLKAAEPVKPEPKKDGPKSGAPEPQAHHEKRGSGK